MALNNWVFATIDKIWEFIKDIGSILKPCRFSIILLIAVSAFLILADQGQDVLRALTERQSSSFLQIIWFFLALLLWAINTWYWARVMLRFNFRKNERFTAECEPLTPEQEKRRIKIRRYLPRFLGTFAFLITALAFYKTSGSSSSAPLYFIVACLVFAAVFLLATTKRIPMLQFVYKQVSARSFANKTWIKPIVSSISMDAGDQPYKETYKNLTDVSPATWAMLGILAFISITLFLTFTLSANSAASLGTAAIVLTAAASWISFGSGLVYFGSKNSFPIMTLFLLAAVLFSLWNDNHEIRYLEKKELSNRSTLTNNANQWFANLNDIRTETNTKQIPYFIVAAEGGGIRAAYWTALVLSAFQDSNPNFSKHVYAISGVSGGSLGAATFAAVLHEWSKQQVSDTQEKPDVKCNYDNQTTGLDKASTQLCTTAVLANDFLSPTVAYMLYPDLLQRFLPFSVPVFDRSRALEGSWESAWEKVFPGNDAKNETLFNQSFLDLWKIQNNSHHNLIPNLFLNATWVETGKRVITSNIKIDADTFSDSKDFFSVLNKEVRLSTAVHNSARFTYVSPAGTVQPPQQKEAWGHLVDGGYFENSGATTAYDILTAINDKGNVKKVFKPVVIVITNDPKVKEPCDMTKNIENHPSNKGCTPRKFMNELYSPIATMIQTRNARGSYARAEVKNYLDKKGLYLEIGLCKDKGPLPLGWTLSDDAKLNMEGQLKNYLKKAEKNVNKFDPLKYEHLAELEKILNKSCEHTQERL